MLLFYLQMYNVYMFIIAQDNEIRESLHDSFHLTPCLAEAIKTHAGVPGDHFTAEVRIAFRIVLKPMFLHYKNILIIFLYLFANMLCNLENMPTDLIHVLERKKIQK